MCCNSNYILSDWCLTCLSVTVLGQYSGDSDDKVWLYENHHMPATGGKAYLLLVEDIQELAATGEYK